MLKLFCISFSILLCGQVSAQHWEAFERTRNDLIFIDDLNSSTDTLYLEINKKYEIILNDITDQIGTPLYRLQVNNTFPKDVFSYGLKQEVQYIDYSDTLCITKLLLNTKSNPLPLDRSMTLQVIDNQSNIKKKLHFLVKKRRRVLVETLAEE